MYSSPDDARSDLFLAGAVFLFGPLVVQILLDIAPLPDFEPLFVLVDVAVPIAVTVLAPYLLIRYRKEPLGAYGFSGVQTQNLALGALLGLPLAIASVLALLVRFGPETANPLALTTVGGAPMIATRLAHAIGRCLLAVYVTVKARDAFRQDYLAVREGLRDIGRWVVIGSAGALLLLTLSAVLRGQGIGLLVGVLTETKRGAWGAIGLGGVIALVTIFQTV
ncbi:MAG TPA: hypothetical protein VNU01_10310 [Egibacteraceae bacterium]|nr:hypothetical protein [Egibacteraceae bacterium]